MSIVRSIIFVIIMLGVLASLHELAHFWVAKLLKIKVYEVSIFIESYIFLCSEEFFLDSINLRVFLKYFSIEGKKHASIFLSVLIVII